MTVLMPIVSAGAGALLLDEPITTSLLLGGVIVLAGVYVGALSGGVKRRVDGPEIAPAEEPSTA
jgi:drug/metabolite transporter (DMT)-like permease